MQHIHFSTKKKISLFGMVILYIFAGSFHFIHPAFYIAIMPSFIPAPKTIVFISGIFEILLALFLIPERTRRYAAIGIIILLITVFPANIQMTINYYRGNNPNLWLTIIRLPLQIVLIWWANFFAKTNKAEHITN